jgi:hypothetical protein
MGMDISGLDPVSEEAGFYFRATVWTWRPLASLLKQLYPDLTDRIKYLDSNDGDGLDRDGARELGRRMHQDLADGTIAALLRSRDAALAALPDELCGLCKGTGVRGDAVGVMHGMVERGTCNGCDGAGAKRPFETYYELDFATVFEFADFVAASGGFEIW